MQSRFSSPNISVTISFYCSKIYIGFEELSNSYFIFINLGSPNLSIKKLLKHIFLFGEVRTFGLNIMSVKENVFYLTLSVGMLF